jgi:hypothetical protein
VTRAAAYRPARAFACPARLRRPVGSCRDDQGRGAPDALNRAVEGHRAQVVSKAEWSAGNGSHRGAASRLGLLIVLGIVLAYTVIALVNTVLMATPDRSGERLTLGLLGATRGQVLRYTAAEALVTTAVGVVLAAAATLLALAGLCGARPVRCSARAVLGPCGARPVRCSARGPERIAAGGHPMVVVADQPARQGGVAGERQPDRVAVCRGRPFTRESADGELAVETLDRLAQTSLTTGQPVADRHEQPPRSPAPTL